MKDLELKISKLSEEIEALNRLATDAYKRSDYETENKLDDEMEPLKVKRAELRKELFEAYQKQFQLERGVLDKFENTPIYASIIGKVCWVSQPLIRQITPESLEDKKLVYLKMDATDGFSGKTEQFKLYLMPHVAREIMSGISESLGRMG